MQTECDVASAEHDVADAERDYADAEQDCGLIMQVVFLGKR